jgi:hypothetical protein
LKKTVAVSFEGNNIKIVHTSLKGKTLSIDKSDIIPNEDFDNYLQNEKAVEFIVTYEFKESYHNVLTVPVLKPKYLEKVVEAEIRKIVGKGDFSFVYFPLGEKVIENRKSLEIFYFAVHNAEIRNIVDRFHNNGKIVKALFPSVFSAAALFEDSTSEKANMGVLGIDKQRTVFFMKNHIIHFIRNYESLDAEFSDFDVQNINMTINYCFQNIRITPSSVILLGRLTESSNINTLPTAPLASLYKTEQIQCSREVLNEYFLPIASNFAPNSSNILSNEFKNVYNIRNYLSYASAIFIFLTILCLGFISFEVKGIINKKEQIKSIAKNRPDIQRIYAEYIRREDKINKLMPVINFLNRNSPEIQKLLTNLSEIDIQSIKYNSIEARAKDEHTFLVLINGTSTDNTYSSLQASFSTMVRALEKIKGIEIKEKSINLQDKSFRLEMNYRKQG